MKLNKNTAFYYWFIYTISEFLIIYTVFLFLSLSYFNIFLASKGLIVLLATITTSEVLKSIIKAPRPSKHLLTKKTDSSFPSTHSALAFGVAFSYLLYGEALFIAAIFFIFAFLVALGRVLAGAHFPKDVIAGAFLALLVALACFYFKLGICIG